MHLTFWPKSFVNPLSLETDTFETAWLNFGKALIRNFGRECFGKLWQANDWSARLQCCSRLGDKCVQLKKWFCGDDQSCFCLWEGGVAGEGTCQDNLRDSWILRVGEWLTGLAIPYWSLGLSMEWERLLPLYSLSSTAGSVMLSGVGKIRPLECTQLMFCSEHNWAEVKAPHCADSVVVREVERSSFTSFVASSWCCPV